MKALKGLEQEKCDRTEAEDKEPLQMMSKPGWKEDWMPTRKNCHKIWTHYPSWKSNKSQKLQRILDHNKIVVVMSEKN